MLAEHAAALHDARAAAGPRLADAVRERLAELAMEGASFEVGLLAARGARARRARTTSSS